MRKFRQKKTRFRKSEGKSAYSYSLSISKNSLSSVINYKIGMISTRRTKGATNHKWKKTRWKKNTYRNRDKEKCLFLFFFVGKIKYASLYKNLSILVTSFLMTHLCLFLRNGFNFFFSSWGSPYIRFLSLHWLRNSISFPISSIYVTCVSKIHSTGRASIHGVFFSIHRLRNHYAYCDTTYSKCCSSFPHWYP